MKYGVGKSGKTADIIRTRQSISLVTLLIIIPHPTLSEPCTQLGSFAQTGTPTVVIELLSGVSTSALMAALRSRYPNATHLTTQLIEEVLQKNPTVFGKKAPLITPQGTLTDTGEALVRFANELHGNRALQRRDLIIERQHQAATTIVKELREGRVPTMRLAPELIPEVIARLSVSDIERLATMNSSEPLKRFLADIWQALDGKPTPNSHEVLLSTVRERLRYEKGLLVFSSKRRMSDIPLSQLKWDISRSFPPPIPGWSRHALPEFDVTDRQQRILTVMHQVGSDKAPWLSQYSDVTAHRAHSLGEHEVDPWVKDQLPIALPVGSGRNKHYRLLHYNARNGKRGSFSYAKTPVARPQGLPPEARAFEENGFVFWAVPVGTELRFEGGNFQKTNDFAFITERVNRENPARSPESIREELAELSGVDKDKLIVLESAPGERTGHVDLIVRVIDYEKNTVVVPQIPDYILGSLKPEERTRRELSAKYNAYLDGIANRLTAGGVIVKRIPMFSPEPLKDGAGRLIDKNHPQAPSQSPFGVDVWFNSTANFSDGPGGTFNVPVSIRQLEGWSLENQRRFHSAMADVFGDRYNPVGADEAFASHGAFHCLTWSVNVATGHVSRPERY